MAEFIAKLGLDASGFVSGMEAAAGKAGGVASATDKIPAATQKASAGVKDMGNALESVKAKAGSVASSLADVGKTALGMFGGGLLLKGIDGIVGGFDEMINKGLDVMKMQNAMKAAFAGTGLEGKALDSSLKQNAKNVERLSFEYAVGKAQINEATKAFLNFGGKSQDLAKTQEQLIVLQQRYGLSAEAAGKLLGKATDPENEASLKKIGIVFDKNATEAERQAKLTEKLSNSMAILKEQANGPVGSIERFKNSLAGFKTAVASSLIETLAPILANLSDAAEVVINVVLPAFKSGLKSLKETLEPVGAAIKEGIISTLQAMWGIVQPIIMGLYNAFVNVKNAIFPATESTTSLKDTFASLAPIISGVVSVMTVIGAIMAANYVRTQLMTAANAAYAAVTGGMQAIISGVSTAQTLLNAVMAANPIGAVVVAVAALAAGFYMLYQKSETFRNIIASIWDWIKKAASMFVELQMKFNPIIGLFRLAYDNIKPFRDAVDYAIEKVMKLWDAVKGVASAIGSFFSTSEESKPPAKKEEKKPAEPIAVGGTGSGKEEAADAEEAAKKKDEASKKLVDTKQKELQLATASLTVEQQKSENAIKQQAINEKRNLTEKERQTILLSQLKLNSDIEAATRRILQVTGEGANIKIGLKLNAEAANELKVKVMGDLSKLGDEKIKIGTELVKLSDEQKKELSEAIKKAAADIKDNVKDALTFKTFIENPLDAFGQITSAIQQLRDKANEAAAIGDAKLNETLLSQAEDLQKKLDGLLKDQKTKQAEEDKKKAAEAAQAQAQRRSDIEKLFIRKIEEEKIASNKRIAANTELLDALKREEAALYESLRKREIGYEQFSMKLVDIEARRAAAQATIQKESTSAFSQTMNGALKATNEVLASELRKMTASYDEEFNKQLEAGKMSLEGLAGAAVTQFGAMIVSGASAGDALKEVSKGVVGKLIDMYVAPVILSTLSFLGPFALPVATALVASAKSLFASAVAGFQDGGYTGDGGPSQIAGVVHGQEFVHTADVTRKHRGLFEHLHKGGELSSWMVTTAGALQAPAVAAPQLNTYGIESRLDRLEMAINRGNRKFESMRAVQMTVEHDPTLTIKAQSRNVEIRSARS